MRSMKLEEAAAAGEIPERLREATLRDASATIDEGALGSNLAEAGNDQADAFDAKSGWEIGVTLS